MASTRKSANPATATMTIRNVEASLKRNLRIRAARNGRSMEEEARQILRSALQTEQSDTGNLVEAIHRRFADLGGVDLPELPREPMREPPRFD